MGLATKLLDQDTCCIGTLRTDGKNNPQDLMSKKLKKEEHKSCSVMELTLTNVMTSVLLLILLPLILGMKWAFSQTKEEL